MFGIDREVPHFREYVMFFFLYVFHIKLGLSLFLDLCMYFNRQELQIPLTSLQFIIQS